MAVAVQVGALLRKGLAAQSHRGCAAQLAQLLLPLGLVVLFASASFLEESEVAEQSGVDRVAHLEDPFETKYAARLCPGAIFAVAPEHGIGAAFRHRLAAVSASPPRLVPFHNAQAVEDYARAETYGKKSPPLCGAVTFEEKDGSKYTIRLNGTIVGNRGAVCGGVDTRRPLGGRAIDAAATSQDWYLCSGFLSLQRLVDDFVLARGGRKPQLQVDVLPFPTPSFKQRKALGSLREFIGLFLVAFFAYASGSAASSIVAEREARLLEAMQLLGLQNNARYLAETLQVLPLFGFYGVQLSWGLDIGVFTRSDPTLLGLFLCCTGLSFGALALCASACFQSARSASLSLMVGVFGLSRLPSEQVWTLLLPPVALTRGLAQVFDLELAGSGLQWSNIRLQHYATCSLAQVMLAQAAAVPIFLWLRQSLEKAPRRRGLGPKTSTVTRHRARGAKISEETLPVTCTVEMQNVRKEFLVGRHGVVAVKHLDLGLAQGEIVALLGHNGAGKSTTVGMLTGMIPATQGRVTIHGFDVATHPEEARRHLGVCPQHDVLFDHLSTNDHLRLARHLRGVKAAVAVQDLLEAVDLTGAMADTPAGQLSAGRRRALCVALAFVGDPRFILLDEPTSGMDPYVRRSMWELLKKYRPGRALCLSTHYMDEAEMLGDHVCILSRGTLQCYGSPEWLKGRLGSGYALTLMATEVSSTAQPPWLASRTSAAAHSALDLLKTHAPREFLNEMVVARCEGREAVLRLPFALASSFPKLLKLLESQKALLGISSLNISANTLEELFLRLADGDEPVRPSSPKGKAQAVKSRGLNEQAASSMGEIMGDLARPSQAMQATALFRKRWLTLQRSRRAMLCLCLLPMIFNILGVASIAASFELDSPPLEISSTAEVLQPGRPLVVAFAAQRGTAAEAFMKAGEGALWARQRLQLPKYHVTSPRKLSKSLLVDASVLRGSGDDEDLDMSKYQDLQRQGAPEFVLRRIMAKDGIPTPVAERFFSGTEPGKADQLNGRLTIGLKQRAVVSLDPQKREVSVQLTSGEAPLRVDVRKPEEQREELAQCASGGPMQMQLAEDAMRRLDEDTKKTLLAMQEGGAPMFAQRAYLEKAGIAVEDVEVLAASASPEAVPSERMEQLERCAQWQAFASALLETRSSLEESRYGGIFVERLKGRRGRLAIFQNTSVFHSAPLFLSLAMKALVEDVGRNHSRVPEVTNWPLPLTHRQRSLAFSSQGWSFFSMSLLGVAFLPAGLAVEAAAGTCSGAVRQQAIAGMPLMTYLLTGFFADVVLVLPPALAQLGFVYYFQMAIFVDCLGTLAVLLGFYVLASTAQVYAMLPRFRSPMKAQSSVLALNVVSGFFLALTVWVLGIPFLGDTANRLARIFTLLGRLSPAFNLSNAILTIPNTSMPGFSTVDGLAIQDWRVTGEPLVALAANLLIYSLLALRRRGELLFVTSTSKGHGKVEPPTRDPAQEVKAERLAAHAAMESPVPGLAVESFSASYASQEWVLEPLSFVAGSGILGVLGVSGSGKSTILAALAGALPKGGRMLGKALLDGKKLETMHHTVGAVGYCPQENELTPGLTVREQIELFGSLRGLQHSSEVHWLCEALDLEAFEESLSENLSGGNQRKLQCACALVGSPRLVCLDEPSAGLDPMARRCLGNALRAKMQSLSTVVIATKSVDEADALCSKLLFLTKDGCLRSVGSAAEIRRRYASGHELRVALSRPSLQEVYQQLRSSPARQRRLGDAELLQCLEAGEAPLVEIPEDSEEMTLELARRSRAILEELRPLFPRIEQIEEVSLSRIFQLNDSEKEVSELFRQVEVRKKQLKIAEYSITQATLEHVFNQLAREDH